MSDHHLDDDDGPGCAWFVTVLLLLWLGLGVWKAVEVTVCLGHCIHHSHL